MSYQRYCDELDFIANKIQRDLDDTQEDVARQIWELPPEQRTEAIGFWKMFGDAFLDIFGWFRERFYGVTNYAYRGATYVRNTARNTLNRVIDWISSLFD